MREKFPYGEYMVMQNEERILCAASAYEKKYYLNPAFGKLPEAVKEELRTMSVLFTEKAGGTFQAFFAEDGELLLRTDCEPDDFSYDEIGAGLLIGEMRREYRELFEELSLFYRVVFLKEEIPED